MEINSSVLEYRSKNGIYFYCYSTAEKPALVLIMGYGGSHATWPRSFIEKLSQDFTVITLDNRGTGKSIKPNDYAAYAVSHLADDLVEGVDVLAPQGFVLLGYSLGGCVALEYSKRHPERVKRLILMSTTGGGNLYIAPPPGTLDALRRPVGNTLWELYLSTWRYCFSDEGLKRYEPVLREIFEASRQHLTPLVALEGQLQGYLQFSSENWLPNLQMPIYLITGAEDRLTPSENSHRLSRHLPRARLREIAQCEHAPHIEAEEDVIGVVHSSFDATNRE